MKKQVIIGGGYGGLWSVFGAQRLIELNHANSEIEVVLINETDYHCARPRLYEADLSNVSVALAPICDTVGAIFLQARVNAIDTNQQSIITNDEQTIDYDQLILATGSQV